VDFVVSIRVRKPDLRTESIPKGPQGLVHGFSRALRQVNPANKFARSLFNHVYFRWPARRFTLVIVNLAQKTELVCSLGHKAGFECVGIVPAEPLARKEYFNRWLDSGRHGEMDYLAQTREVRVDPRLLLDGARSVIVVAHQYKQSVEDRPPPAEPGGDPAADGPRGRIARYAWGRDYHRLIRMKLHRLVDALHHAIDEPFETRVCVDTAPIMERELAAAAGIGWVGKNTMVINPRLGSFFFLGEIVTTLTLLFSEPIADRCGSCRRCLDACPTRALIGPYQMDATRCIAYLTIEHRGTIPQELRSLMGDWIFGCDVCQNVCPYNRNAPPTVEPRYELDDRNPLPPRPLLEPLLAWTTPQHRACLAGSAMKRATIDMLHRNAEIALCNMKTPKP